MRIKDLDSMINDDSDGGDDDVDGFGLQEMESAAVSTRQERNSILQVKLGWMINSQFWSPLNYTPIFSVNILG